MHSARLIVHVYKYFLWFTAECAPTLAPWKPPNEVTTSEATQHQNANDAEKHAIYDINDIVHFEDNDIVMRDAKRSKVHDNNKLDNSVEPFKTYSSYNDVKTHFGLKDNKSGVVKDVDNDLNSDDKKEDKSCECQHGGGCVANVCLCPLGYAGVKCEITLDLKVSHITFCKSYTHGNCRKLSQSYAIQCTKEKIDSLVF